MKVLTIKSLKKGFLALVLGLIFAPQTLLGKDRLKNCPQNQDLVSWCQKSLENDEKELQKELFTLVDIHSTNEWVQAKKELLPDYDAACAYTTTRERDNKPLPAALVTPIKNVLNKPKIRTALGITRVECPADNACITAHRNNGQTITFACGNKKIQADAATDQYTTLLDPEELLTTHKNGTELEATIAHELMHVAHEDDLNVYCLNQLQAARGKAHKTQKKEFARLKGEWERLQEERADMLAGIVDLEYAKASTEQFKRTMSPAETLLPTSTHPTGQMRYEYMHSLAKEMAHRQTQFPFSTQNLLLALVLSFIVICSIVLLLRIKTKHARDI